MAKITLITGGAASGKSRWAISHFEACDNVLYLCAAPHLDKEAADRIKWVGRASGTKWEIQTGCRLRSANIADHQYIIYDSLARYTADMITAFTRGSDYSAEKEKLQRTVAEDVEHFIDKVNDAHGNLVMITNETGFSVAPSNNNQRGYREILGFVNQRTAHMASDVYMSISGVQIKIK
ncbi:MAG: bifunctional adenosylcobinamide kinase/adenosylcobinamide-phosphate guanylyltransferase [Ruminococcus sp.]|nr:bifunctional adenosylcobinamide kinase/adenosylcobinamide-phosphate guanylyltransferase [Ruminococcus sp.]